MMPLACSITGMLESRALSRAYAECRSQSGWALAAIRRARICSVWFQASWMSCQFTLVLSWMA